MSGEHIPVSEYEDEGWTELEERLARGRLAGTGAAPDGTGADSPAHRRGLRHGDSSRAQESLSQAAERIVGNVRTEWLGARPKPHAVFYATSRRTVEDLRRWAALLPPEATVTVFDREIQVSFGEV